MFSRRDLVVSTAAAALVGPSLALGAKASSFSLRNLAGKSVGLEDYADRVVFLSFWATWCGPCKVEMRHLHGFHQELHDKGLTVLFISIDDARAAPLVKGYVRAKRYQNDLFLLDPQSTAVGLFNPKKTVPYSVLIGRGRDIVKTWEGFNPGDESEVKAAIEAELAKSS